MKYTIDEILKRNKDKFDKNGHIYEKQNGKYIKHTYKEFCEDVYRYSNYFKDNHLGSVIAIYSQNSYWYMVIDAAVMAYIGISMTLSKEWTYHDLDRVFSLKEVHTLIYDKPGEKTAEKLKEKYPNINFINISDINPKEDYTILPEKSIDECCKVIFSSGTTGIPKGVMLCQRNMFASWENLYHRTPLNDTDVDYLFLPLSHTYAGICNFLYSLISGMKIYLCSDTRKIFEEIQEVKPTIFCAVPLIYERLYSVSKEKNIPPSVLLGGNIKYLFSGGAYMSPKIRQCFKEDGLNFLESYGLSETSSIVSVEYSNSYDDFISCGKLFEHLDVKISGDGEIFVKGDNIFLGYYGDEELTEKCFTSDGYFKTGDLGEIHDNKLYLIGRKKRVIILSNGENVYPDDIEMLFDSIPNINKVKVFEKDNEIHAIFYVSKEIAADENVARVNETIPKFARIRSYEVIQDSIAKRMK